MIKLKENRKVHFDALTHTYWCGDRELTGVTAMMKHQGLSPDYGGVDPHVLAHAAARGTAVHRTLEEYDNGETVVQPVTVDDNEGGELTIDTSADLNAYRGLGLEVIRSEYLVSDNKAVASSIDKVLSTGSDDTVDLADIKTTYELHTDALEWQLSIYAYLFEIQNKGVKVRDLYGIHVRKGAARMQKVRRIDPATVKELISCEAKGKRFDAGGTEPQLSLVLAEDEIASLVTDEYRVAGMKEAVKQMEAAMQERRDRIYAYMLDSGTKELACPGGRYRLRNPSTRTTLNGAAIKKELPDIYEKYSSVTEVRGSVTFVPDNSNTDN